MPPRLVLLILAIGMAAVGRAQAKQGYPACRALDTALVVGEVPNNPFTAAVIQDAWEPAPDGSRKHVDASKREGTYFIARDSKGRVIVRAKIDAKLHSAAGQGKFAVYSDTICDPEANTATWFSYHDVFTRALDSAGQPIYSPAGQAGFAEVKTQTDPRTTTTFRAYHRKMNGREEVGPEIFEGVPAFRYRYLKTPERDPMVQDIVISEDLEVLMAQITWDEDHTYLREVRLANVDRKEPDPIQMQPARGVMLNWRTVAPILKTLPPNQAPDKQ